VTDPQLTLDDLPQPEPEPDVPEPIRDDEWDGSLPVPYGVIPY
jgi:hypothetical protein